MFDDDGIPREPATGGRVDRDINEAPFVAGNATFLPESGDIVVSSAGEGIFAAADGFGFVSTPASGSFVLTVRVDSYAGFLDALAGAGEMGFGTCSKQNGAVTEVRFSHVTLTKS